MDRHGDRHQSGQRCGGRLDKEREACSEVVADPRPPAGRISHRALGRGRRRPLAYQSQLRERCGDLVQINDSLSIVALTSTASAGPRHVECIRATQNRKRIVVA